MAASGSTNRFGVTDLYLLAFLTKRDRSLKQQIGRRIEKKLGIEYNLRPPVYF